MFSINGIDLTDPAREWAVTSNSQPLAEISVDRASLVLPGRDGIVSLAGRVEPPSLPLEILTPLAGLDALTALFAASPLELTWDDRTVAVERMSYKPKFDSVENGDISVAVLLRLMDVYWRDPADSTSDAFALAAASVDVDVFAGLTGPVRDAILLVAGDISGLKIAGGDGSWISYGVNVPAGSWLRIETETGRAWLTDSETWTGGVEVTGAIANGPGSYPLTIAPTFTDPSTRAGRLTVTSTARAGASLKVRGRAAYSV